LPLLLVLTAEVAIGFIQLNPRIGYFVSNDASLVQNKICNSALQMKTKDTVRENFKLFNTETRDKRQFRTLKPKMVKFYSCGPTIYDFAHIGNFRAFLTYDLLKRWLMYLGYEVDHICNLTDIDDKIIKRMQRDRLSLQELTEKYAQHFFEDLEMLNIVPASKYPRATEHINEMVEMIQTLVEKGFAYENNGSYYFRVSKHTKYGSLAHLDFDGMKDGAGEGGGITDADEYTGEKSDAKDFALWKAYKPEDGSVFWDTPLGRGRPGWHIECSAMAQKYLGATLDVHAGGVDLTFPHHENEIAQSEGYSGANFCNCWVHNGFVNINNEKMSKSKGNFLTLRDTLKTSLEIRGFRYLVVTSQYRMALNFTPESLNFAKNTIKRLDKFQKMLLNFIAKEEGKEEITKGTGDNLCELAEKSLEGFEAGMNDDLNTPRAAASMFQLVKAGEKAFKSDSMTLPGARAISSTLEAMDNVLGVFYSVPGLEDEDSSKEAEVPEEVFKLGAERKEAKASKDWAKADSIRDKLLEMGYSIKDVQGGEFEFTRIK